MRIAAFLSLLLGCLAVAISPARAAEGHSPLAWLGLGKSQSKSLGTTNVSSTRATPQVFARMSNGTKRLVNNTKNMFASKKPPRKSMGTIATRKPPSEPAKAGLFQRWFPSEPEPPRTVGEWMSLDQVQP